MFYDVILTKPLKMEAVDNDVVTRVDLECSSTCIRKLMDISTWHGFIHNKII